MEEETALQVFAFTLRGEIARELKNNFTYEDEEESTTLLKLREIVMVGRMDKGTT